MQEANAEHSRAMDPSDKLLQAARERDRQFLNIPYMLRSSERGYAWAPCICKLACSSAAMHASLIYRFDKFCMFVMQSNAR